MIKRYNKIMQEIVIEGKNIKEDKAAHLVVIKGIFHHE